MQLEMHFKDHKQAEDALGVRLEAFGCKIIPLALTELLGVPLRAESSSDDSVLSRPASEEGAKTAEGVAGIESSSSSRLRG